MACFEVWASHAAQGYLIGTSKQARRSPNFRESMGSKRTILHDLESHVSSAPSTDFRSRVILASAWRQMIMIRGFKHMISVLSGMWNASELLLSYEKAYLVLEDDAKTKWQWSFTNRGRRCSSKDIIFRACSVQYIRELVLWHEAAWRVLDYDAYRQIDCIIYSITTVGGLWMDRSPHRAVEAWK